jgi:hypothetical protein
MMSDCGSVRDTRRRMLAFGLAGGLCLVGGCGDPEAGSMAQAKKSKKDVVGADDGSKAAPAAKQKKNAGRPGAR